MPSGAARPLEPVGNGRYEAGVSKSAAVQSTAPQPIDPMANPLKGIGLRVGLPILGLWVVAILIGRDWALIGMGVITVVAAGVVLWVLRFVSKTRQVANIIKGADTPEARKEALSQLETNFKKGDTAAIFAKAQLQMHEDRRLALTTLEQIDLGKVMAPVADEARANRAMIHLLLGEPDRARQLVDGIDLGRHQQPKMRATLVAVIGESWARTGQGKKALDSLSVFNPEDAEFGELKPQLYRSLAFAHAAVNDTKGIRQDLRKLMAINPQLLFGFLEKKIHPLLEREAKEMLKRSGVVPKKMVMRRM